MINVFLSPYKFHLVPQFFLSMTIGQHMASFAKVLPKNLANDAFCRLVINSCHNYYTIIRVVC